MAISGGVPQSNNVQLQTIMDFNTLLLITILILVGFWFVGLVRKIRALGGICSERLSFPFRGTPNLSFFQAQRFGVPRNGKLRSTGAITTVPCPEIPRHQKEWETKEYGSDHNCPFGNKFRQEPKSVAALFAGY